LLYTSAEWRDFASISGLPRRAGAAWPDMPALVLKELADNAADEGGAWIERSTGHYRCTGAAGHPLWSAREPLETPCRKDVEAMHEDGPPLILWHAITYYRTENGTVEIEHDLEELWELHNLIELGPHWDTIEKIEVFRVNHITDEKLTVERSQTERL
jgi:hypothetical protein